MFRRVYKNIPHSPVFFRGFDGDRLLSLASDKYIYMRVYILLNFKGPLNDFKINLTPLT